TSKLRPFDLTQDEIRRSRTAYPGSMLVYTAAKTYGLPTATAQDVAQFIRVSSTEGQKPGRGNVQLAAGYVPLASSGVTAGLYQQAQQVADAVAAQKAPPTQPAHDSPKPPEGPPSRPAPGAPARGPPRAGTPG